MPVDLGVGLSLLALAVGLVVGILVGVWSKEPSSPDPNVAADREAMAAVERLMEAADRTRRAMRKAAFRAGSERPRGSSLKEGGLW